MLDPSLSRNITSVCRNGDWDGTVTLRELGELGRLGRQGRDETDLDNVIFREQNPERGSGWWPSGNCQLDTERKVGQCPFFALRGQS